jgi:hypothetical protein
MKNYLTLIFAIILSFNTNAQILNGAWRLVEVNDQPVEHETIKLYSNSYFTYSEYDKDTGKFISARGGLYFLNNLNYKEQLDIDSRDPLYSGTTVEYEVSLSGREMIITNLSTGEQEKWQKFDDADNYKMAFCWRIHKKKDEGDKDWRIIEYRPRKTLKMMTNSRYQVLALNSKTGQFVGSSGGTWSSEGDSYVEHVEFFSKDQTNVGRSLEFQRAFEDGLWLHTGKTTKDGLMMEMWHRYK